MPSQISNIVIDQGTSFSTIIELEDDDGNTLTLTDYTGSSEMRRHYSSINVAAIFVVSINANLGQVTLALDANTTANIYQGRYVYDVVLTDLVGTKTRVVEGQVTVIPSVTHP